jgi:hypothetical protein
MAKSNEELTKEETRFITFESRINQLILTPEGVEIKLSKSVIPINGIRFLAEIQKDNEPVKIKIDTLQGKLV